MGELSLDGLTLDTSALIALERRRLGMAEVIDAARLVRRPIVVPSTVIAEWWRGRTDRRNYVLGMCVVKDVDTRIAKLAGEALAKVHTKMNAELTIDATVMATAAIYGPNLYTGDRDDMDALVDFFPSVRLFGLRMP